MMIKFVCALCKQEKTCEGSLPEYDTTEECLICKQCAALIEMLNKATNE